MTRENFTLGLTVLSMAAAIVIGVATLGVRLGRIEEKVEALDRSLVRIEGRLAASPTSPGTRLAEHGP